MSQNLKDLVRQQIAAADDDLARCRAAMRRSDPFKEWGQSGQTLTQIEAGYVADREKWLAELAKL